MRYIFKSKLPRCVAGHDRCSQLVAFVDGTSLYLPAMRTEKVVIV